MRRKFKKFFTTFMAMVLLLSAFPLQVSANGFSVSATENLLTRWVRQGGNLLINGDSQARSHGFSVDAIWATPKIASDVELLKKRALLNGGRASLHNPSLLFTMAHSPDLYLSLAHVSYDLFVTHSNGKFDISLSIHDTYDFHQAEAGKSYVSNSVTKINNFAYAFQQRNNWPSYKVTIWLSKTEDSYISRVDTSISGWRTVRYAIYCYTGASTASSRYSGFGAGDRIWVNCVVYNNRGEKWAAVTRGGREVFINCDALIY